MAAAGELQEAVSGDVLFRQGTLPESLYVLFDGRVSLTGTSADASSTVIDIVEPASSFVLANVLTDEPYLMGAETVSDSLTGAHRGRTDAAGGGGPSRRRHGDDAGDVGRAEQHDPPGGGPEGPHRGTKAGDVSAEPGEGAAGDRREFRLPVSKGLLGPWLGCRAENLSRAFGALRGYGVETHGSRVVLHDVARLRAYAGAIEPANEPAHRWRRCSGMRSGCVRRIA